MSTTDDVVRVLGGLRGVRRPIRTFDQMTRAIRDGIPFHALMSVAMSVQLDPARIGRVLRIPSRTLARRQKQGRLSAEESDRLARLARIIAMANETFGEQDKVAQWFQRPNRALAQAAPLDLLDTDWGTVAVESLLGRIQHGVFS